MEHQIIKTFSLNLSDEDLEWLESQPNQSRTVGEAISFYRLCQKFGWLDGIPRCERCDRELRGTLSQQRGYCSLCWLKTEEGKKQTAERVSRLRKSRKKS